MASEFTGMYLGKFQLNGYLFEAYEREGNNGGKEFRLVSTPSVNPAQEAAFIRYIIQEDLINNTCYFGDRTLVRAFRQKMI